MWGNILIGVGQLPNRFFFNNNIVDFLSIKDYNRVVPIGIFLTISLYTLLKGVLNAE